MNRAITAVFLLGFLAWAFQSIRPPPPNLCGSPHGPPITATRVKLRDGRHLAYKEYGVPKEMAKYKIIYSHPFGSGRHDSSILTSEIAEELGVYLVIFDRPGYGESDPDPNRSEKSIPFDVEELADQLGLGSKFYVIGYSMGGQLVWGCLKYIPHRLAGATLIAPVINYWWPGFPKNLSKESYHEQLLQDQWAVRVAHYAPWLTYWWNTQKWFPKSSVISGKAKLSNQDIELLTKQIAGKPHRKENVTQQGEFESLHRDMMVGFGHWGFDPMDIEKPNFINEGGSVHMWHGDEDGIVPASLQRYIAKRLPWIQYHEVSGGGHMFPLVDGMTEAIFKALLVGTE